MLGEALVEAARAELGDAPACSCKAAVGMPHRFRDCHSYDCDRSDYDQRVRSKIKAAIDIWARNVLAAVGADELEGD